ncbi:hypothetical protein Adt_31806 [Abeliophyllum distichum]|uniref:Uncharacterized protein n=1 Tax=Abeliophyllum distichum TaxID=126358 RepID=A0ABD1RF65_9LAMI
MSTKITEGEASGHVGDGNSSSVSPSMVDMLPIRGVDTSTGKEMAITSASSWGREGRLAAFMVLVGKEVDPTILHCSRRGGESEEGQGEEKMSHHQSGQHEGGGVISQHFVRLESKDISQPVIRNVDMAFKVVTDNFGLFEKSNNCSLHHIIQ